jgi:hypothetical protein
MQEIIDKVEELRNLLRNQTITSDFSHQLMGEFGDLMLSICKGHGRPFMTMLGSEHGVPDSIANCILILPMFQGNNIVTEVQTDILNGVKQLTDNASKKLAEHVEGHLCAELRNADGEVLRETKEVNSTDEALKVFTNKEVVEVEGDKEATEKNLEDLLDRAGVSVGYMTHPETRDMLEEHACGLVDLVKSAQAGFMYINAYKNGTEIGGLVVMPYVTDPKVRQVQTSVFEDIKQMAADALIKHGVLIPMQMKEKTPN